VLTPVVMKSSVFWDVTPWVSVSFGFHIKNDKPIIFFDTIDYLLNIMAGDVAVTYKMINIRSMYTFDTHPVL
jgi:hypothetical protein